MGYPQQNWQGYPQQGYAPPVSGAPRQGSPALAVISAVVGLGIVGALVWQTLDLLSLLGDLRSEMPAGWTGMVIAHFVIAGIVLIGAVLVFARRIAGAFILVVSAVLTLGAMLTAPIFADGVGITMISSITDYRGRGAKELYYRALFEFDNTQGVLRFVALALGVVLLIIAVLPPSLNWLRRPRQNGYSAQQVGW